MGKFIGEVRNFEGISLQQLAEGLCTAAYLNQIENGQREAGKQLTDALLQRLGKSVDLFELILDQKEFEQWKLRQEIAYRLSQGDISRASELLRMYAKKAKGTLAQQFVQTAEINVEAEKGASADELLLLVQEALKLTHPNFEKESFVNILLTQTEGRLLLAWLKLREQTAGKHTVAQAYKDLLQGLHGSRYDSRSRIYLLPYVACHVIEGAYSQHQLQAALVVCDQTLHELALEKCLNAYDRLLEWKRLLLDEMGIPDDLPGKQLRELRAMRQADEAWEHMFIPLEEHGRVLCFNQLVRGRRKLLEMSQEELAEGICDPRTISRIENQNISPQKEIRRGILEKLRMSGERYDYQIISEHYEDYILRSEYARACEKREYGRAAELFAKLAERIPETITNRQYLMAEKVYLRGQLPKEHPEWLSESQMLQARRKVLAITLPDDLEHIHSWPVGVLSINESIVLANIAHTYQYSKEYQGGLACCEYVKKCMDINRANGLFCDDSYLRILFRLSSLLGDMGRYEESDTLTQVCIQNSLFNQNSHYLGLCYYNLAWNLEQQGAEAEKISSLLQRAYVAAEIAGDAVGVRHIQRYYKKFFEKEMPIIESMGRGDIGTNDRLRPNHQNRY